MIRAFKSDEGISFGVIFGELQGALDGIGAGRPPKIEPAQLFRKKGEQRLDQGFSAWVWKVERMGEFGELVLGRFQDFGVGMAHVHDAGAAEEIDVEISIHVLDRGSPGPTEGHGHSLRIGDRGTFVGRLESEEVSGRGTRRSNFDQGSLREGKIPEIHHEPPRENCLFQPIFSFFLRFVHKKGS